MKKGFIRNDLDWDVNRGKFTLRLFGVDNTPLKILIIQFRRKDSVIIISDAITHEKVEFHIVFEDVKNKGEFHNFIMDYIS